MFKRVISKSLFAAIALMPLSTLAKQKVVFLINTKEHDIRGAVTAPYLDEYADILNWQQIAPGAEIFRLRANTTEEVRRTLEVFMGQNPDDKEVVGLFIRSHGERLRLFNEQETFTLKLPEDLPRVFASLQGHFSPQVRIVFNGCEVLEGMNRREALQALQGIFGGFGIKEGTIYANRTVGYEGLENFTRVSVFNKDIPVLQRSLAGVFYVAWPVTLPLAYAMKKAFNRGYLLQISNEEQTLRDTDYYSALKP